MSRIARAQMLKLKEQEFVLASKTLGAGPFRVCKGSHCNPGDAKARVGRLAYRLLQRSNCQNGMLNGTSYNAEQSNTGCRLALTLDVK